MVDMNDAEYRSLLAELSSILSERTYAASQDSIALRDAVCAYVENQRTRGTPLDGIIETVRGILKKAENGSGNATNELAQLLVDWCLEFHGGPPKLVLLS